MASLGRRFTRLVVITSTIFSHSFLLISGMKLDRTVYTKASRSRSSRTRESDTTSRLYSRSKQRDRLTLLSSNERQARRRSSSSASSVATRVCTNERSRLPPISRGMRIYYTIALSVVWCLAVKYSILCALDMNESLRQYNYLTCYMLGRAVVNGRVVEFTIYVTLFVLVFMIFWRTVMLIVRPNFPFYFVEFMLYEPEEVLDHEIKYSELAAGFVYSDSSTRVQRIMEFRDIFNDSEPQQSREAARLSFVLRPNRTNKARSRLHRNVFIFLGLSYLFALMYLSVLIRMVAPVLCTKVGFELAYSGCVDWIRSQPNPAEYSHIYSERSPGNYTPITKQTFIPFDEFVEPNYYHVIRIVWDTLENMLIYFDLFNAFTYPTNLAVMLATDSLTYSNEINRRLRSLIDDILTRRQSEAITLRQRRHSYESVSGTEFRINQVQSMIMDQLALIRAYNGYAAYIIAFAVILWFTYSAIVCSWMFIPGSITETNKLEWYVIQVLAALYTVAIFGCYSVFRVSAKETYALISTLMALDSSSAERRERWLAIARHYYPKPLHCFRLFDTIELSWLSNLKLFTWHIAALFVASTFFTITYRNFEWSGPTSGDK